MAERRRDRAISFVKENTVSGPEWYLAGARFYDALSGERMIYRAGRVAGIRLLGAKAGDVVLDLGCGTGLNFPLLARAVGPDGLVIGLDRSPEMLAVARRRVVREDLRTVRLLEADATSFNAQLVNGLIESTGRVPGVDALFASYSLSVIPDWHAAWAAGLSVFKQEGRAAIVDMQSPTGVARIFTPLARLACALGGSDLHSHPWTAVEADCTDVVMETLRGGHIVAAAGTVLSPPPRRQPRVQ